MNGQFSIRDFPSLLKDVGALGAGSRQSAPFSPLFELTDQERQAMEQQARTRVSPVPAVPGQAQISGQPTEYLREPEPHAFSPFYLTRRELRAGAVAGFHEAIDPLVAVVRRGAAEWPRALAKVGVPGTQTMAEELSAPVVTKPFTPDTSAERVGMALGKIGTDIALTRVLGWLAKLAPGAAPIAEKMNILAKLAAKDPTFKRVLGQVAINSTKTFVQWGTLGGLQSIGGNVQRGEKIEWGKALIEGGKMGAFVAPFGAISALQLGAPATMAVQSAYMAGSSAASAAIHGAKGREVRAAIEAPENAAMMIGFPILMGIPGFARALFGRGYKPPAGKTAKGVTAQDLVSDPIARELFHEIVTQDPKIKAAIDAHLKESQNLPLGAPLTNLIQKLEASHERDIVGKRIERLTDGRLRSYLTAKANFYTGDLKVEPKLEDYGEFSEGARKVADRYGQFIDQHLGKFRQELVSREQGRAGERQKVKIDLRTAKGELDTFVSGKEAERGMGTGGDRRFRRNFSDWIAGGEQGTKPTRRTQSGEVVDTGVDEARIRALHDRVAALKAKGEELAAPITELPKKPPEAAVEAVPVVPKPAGPAGAAAQELAKTRPIGKAVMVDEPSDPAKIGFVKHGRGTYVGADPKGRPDYVSVLFDGDKEPTSVRKTRVIPLGAYDKTKGGLQAAEYHAKKGKKAAPPVVEAGAGLAAAQPTGEGVAATPLPPPTLTGKTVIHTNEAGLLVNGKGELTVANSPKDAAKVIKAIQYLEPETVMTEVPSTEPGKFNILLARPEPVKAVPAPEAPKKPQAKFQGYYENIEKRNGESFYAEPKPMYDIVDESHPRFKSTVSAEELRGLGIAVPESPAIPKDMAAQVGTKVEVAKGVTRVSQEDIAGIPSAVGQGRPAVERVEPVGERGRAAPEGRAGVPEATAGGEGEGRVVARMIPLDQINLHSELQYRDVLPGLERMRKQPWSETALDAAKLVSLPEPLGEGKWGERKLYSTNNTRILRARELGLKEVPAQILDVRQIAREFGLKEPTNPAEEWKVAKHFARINNDFATEATIGESVGAYRELMQGGVAREALSTMFSGPKMRKIEGLLGLNPGGNLLRLIDSPAEISGRGQFEAAASWFGQLRQKYPDKLTNAHENEVFDFLMKGRDKVASVTKEWFVNQVEGKVTDAFWNPQTSKLNLEARDLVTGAAAHMESKLELQVRLDGLNERLKKAETPEEKRIIQEQKDEIAAKLAVAQSRQPDLFGNVPDEAGFMTFPSLPEIKGMVGRTVDVLAMKGELGESAYRFIRAGLISAEGRMNKSDDGRLVVRVIHHFEDLWANQAGKDLKVIDEARRGQPNEKSYGLADRRWAREKVVSEDGRTAYAKGILAIEHPDGPYAQEMSPATRRAFDALRAVEKRQLERGREIGLEQKHRFSVDPDNPRTAEEALDHLASLAETVTRQLIDHPTAKVRLAALRSLEDIRSAFEKVVEGKGSGPFTITTPPLARANHFPRIFTRRVRVEMRAQRGKVFEALQEDMTGKGMAEAFARMIGSDFSTPHVTMEFERQLAQVPHWIKVGGKFVQVIETDPNKVMNWTVSNVNRRLALVETFGNDEVAAKRFQNMQTALAKIEPLLASEFANTLVPMMKGTPRWRHINPDEPIVMFAHGLFDFARMQQLSGSWIAQGGGLLFPAMKFGIRPATQAVFGLIFSPKVRAELREMRMLGNLNRDIFESWAAAENMLEFSRKVGRVGLYPMIVENEIINNISVIAAKRSWEAALEAIRDGDNGWFKRRWGVDHASVIRQGMNDFGFSQADIDRQLKTGLSEMDKTRIARRAPALTNAMHEDILDKPIWLHNSLAQQVLAYTAFTRAVGRMGMFAMKEAGNGNFKPLAYWLLGSMASYEIIAQLKAWINDRKREEGWELWPAPEELEGKTAAQKAIAIAEVIEKNRLYVDMVKGGTLGLAGNLFEAGLYVQSLTDIPGDILVPPQTEAITNWANGFYRYLAKNDPDQFVRWALWRNLPGVQPFRHHGMRIVRGDQVDAAARLIYEKMLTFEPQTSRKGKFVIHYQTWEPAKGKEETAKMLLARTTPDLIQQAYDAERNRKLLLGEIKPEVPKLHLAAPKRRKP